MSIYHDCLVYGASQSPTDKTTHVLSFWVIPGRSQFDQAYVVNMFFEDSEPAIKLESQYENAPEMAVSCSYETFKKFQKKEKEPA